MSASDRREFRAAYADLDLGKQETEYVVAIQRRVDYLAARIAQVDPQKIMHYDRRELAAHRWALKIVLDSLRSHR